MPLLLDVAGAFIICQWFELYIKDKLIANQLLPRLAKWTILKQSLLVLFD